eukprot:scaffold47213_cov270-Isochrysis_galbana.AAC.1
MSGSCSPDFDMPATRGTCDHLFIVVSKACRQVSNWLVAYSRPPKMSRRVPTAVMVCPTRPDGVIPVLCTWCQRLVSTLNSHRSLNDMRVVLPPNTNIDALPSAQAQ